MDEWNCGKHGVSSSAFHYLNLPQADLQLKIQLFAHNIFSMQIYQKLS